MTEIGFWAVTVGASLVLWWIAIGEPVERSR